MECSRRTFIKLLGITLFAPKFVVPLVEPSEVFHSVTFNNILERGLRDTYEDVYRRYPALYSSIFK